MSTQREEIIVRAGFDSTTLQREMQSTLLSVKNWATHIGGAIAGAFAVEKVVEFSKSIFDFAENISLMAERLGVTTAEVQKLDYAATMTGVSIDTVATALDKLARAKEKVLGGGAGAGELAKAFERFGITIAELQKLTPDQLFDRISESVAGTGVNSRVTADAMELLGKAGGKLIPMLKDFRDHAKDAPIVSDEDIDNLRKAKEEIKGMNYQVQALATIAYSRVFQKKTWKEFLYSITHPFTQQKDILKMFADAAPPAVAPIAGAGDDSASDGSGDSKDNSKSGDLYRRRAELARAMAAFAGSKSNSQYLDMVTEMRDIQDQLDVKNAPDELSRLGIERSQALRDLRIEQSKLPIGDEAREAERKKIYGFADRVAGIESEISDYKNSHAQRMEDHMADHTEALQKLTDTVLKVKIVKVQDS